MIATKTSKLTFTTMTRTTLLMLSDHLRQAGILLNLFPIKILLKQCKTLFSPLKAQRDNTVKPVLRNETMLKYCARANVFYCLRVWGLSASEHGV